MQQKTSDHASSANSAWIRVRMPNKWRRTMPATALSLVTIVMLGIAACSSANAQPRATAVAEFAAANATPTHQPTTTSVPATAAATSVILTHTQGVTSAALLSKSFIDTLPRDEKGRIIGGPFVPYLNYSPTMITGKPCPRVTKWTFKVIKLDAPLRSYGIADDPCVVQNAVDDFVRTEFANPAVNTPVTMPKIVPLYTTDPALLDGLQEVIRTSRLDYYLQGKIPYYECDKPRFKLLEVSPQSALVGNNDGTVSGQAIQLYVYIVAQNVEPFSCRLLSHNDGTQMMSLSVTAEQMKGKFKALQVGLLWRANKKRWMVYDFNSVEVESFYQKARELWDAAPNKP